VSTPASVVAAGVVGAPSANTVGGPSTVAPTPSASSTPAPAPAASGGGFLSWLNPFSGAVNFLPNAGLVLVGIVLAVGALLISQKETVVQVATTAAKV
jgi:hypothetical protein